MSRSVYIRRRPTMNSRQQYLQVRRYMNTRPSSQAPLRSCLDASVGHETRATVLDRLPHEFEILREISDSGLFWRKMLEILGSLKPGIFTQDAMCGLVALINKRMMAHKKDPPQEQSSKMSFEQISNRAQSAKTSLMLKNLGLDERRKQFLELIK